MDRIQNLVSIDRTDRKIIFELDLNSRQPYSLLAKKIRISQQVATYRVNRLVEQGIITSFMTVISTLSIGLPLVAKMYLQFSGTTKEKEQEVYHFLVTHKNVNWVARTLGKYDLFTAVMVKDLQTFGLFKEELLTKYGSNINENEILFIEKAYTLPRNYLIHKKPELLKPLQIQHKSLFILGDVEKKILKTIVDNSRITALEIAAQMEINVKTVMSKLQFLQNKGVIQGYRININRQKLGYSYFKLLITLRTHDHQLRKELNSYCLSRDNVVHVIENIGKYELELEIEVQNSESMHQFVKEMRNLHASAIGAIETVEILEELKLSWLPSEF